MQELNLVGIIIIAVIAYLLIRTTIFIIRYVEMVKLKNEILAKTREDLKEADLQTSRMQCIIKAVDSTRNLRVNLEDPKMTDDFKHQFLAKTKTRRTPTGDRAPIKERVPLATTDFADAEGEDDNSVPIYTYNPSLGGTQV